MPPRFGFIALALPNLGYSRLCRVMSVPVLQKRVQWPFRVYLVHANRRFIWFPQERARLIFHVGFSTLFVLLAGFTNVVKEQSAKHIKDRLIALFQGKTKTQVFRPAVLVARTVAFQRYNALCNIPNLRELLS